MLKKSHLFFPVILLLSTPGFSQTYIGKKKDIDKILKNITAFSQNVMNGDSRKIADAYTSDGKIFPSGRDILEGTEILENYWRPSDGYKTLYHKVTPVEIRIVKKTAYDFGYYEGESMNPKGEKSTWQGKYVIVWKKVGKDWKIYLDIWNPVNKPEN